MPERPLDLIHGSLDMNVLVVLKREGEFRGTLKGYDSHLNVVLKDAQEIVDGEIVKDYGRVVIRGDNILLISPTDK